MKTKLIILFLVQACLSSGLTLDELTVSFETKRLRIRHEKSEKISSLQTGYLGALKKLKLKYQRAGRLDNVLEVETETKEISQGLKVLHRFGEKTPADLMSSRKLYERAMMKVELDSGTELIEAADLMEKYLSKLQTQFTKKGDIDEAKRVKLALAALTGDKEITKAKELLARVRLDGNFPVAMRIRRAGDQLEVLVRYDRRGEVSMESRIDNTVEITGETREKGDTKATLLGEFVGAKGYKSDVFTILQEDFNSKMSKKIVPQSLVYKLGATIGDRKGLELKMLDNVKNPTLGFMDTLTNDSSNCVFRLDFHYYIPKENQKLKGFTFRQDYKTPVGGENMTQKGKWTSKSLSWSSDENSQHLRLYFDDLSGSGFFNGGNETVVLDDLSLSYLQFAAHTVTMYKDGIIDGKPLINADAQKAFIQAGKFVKN